jgi:hypothetical protein
MSWLPLRRGVLRWRVLKEITRWTPPSCCDVYICLPVVCPALSPHRLPAHTAAHVLMQHGVRQLRCLQELIAAEAWRAALARASGERVLDDPKLLRRSIKREAQDKARKAKRWAERNAAQQEQQKARQDK